VRIGKIVGEAIDLMVHCEFRLGIPQHHPHALRVTE
jgi:hypothetical protein